jgi:GAF domain
MDDLPAWSAILDQTVRDGHGQAQRICELCISELGVTGGGISMVAPGGDRGVVCATDEVAAHIEDLQFTLGEGPCVEAIQTSAPVLIEDLSAPHDPQVRRWPAFSQGAFTRGAGAVFAFPLRVGSVNVGALDLYRSTPGAMSPNELTGALLAADAAANALVQIEIESEGRDLSRAADLQGAHHMQVHQATGMVTVQLDVPIEDALSMLRARAFSTGLPLAEVARDVVDRRLRFTKEDQ